MHIVAFLPMAREPLVKGFYSRLRSVLSSIIFFAQYDPTSSEDRDKYNEQKL